MNYKRKKTRKQKIIADYRHQLYILENKSSTFSHGALNSHEKSSVIGNLKKVLDKNTSFNISTPSVTPNKNSYSYSYSYVLADVVKTGLLTTLIVMAQLILFFLLKNHIITLPKISY